MTDEQAKLAADLHAKGATDVQIADAVGRSESSVRRWRKRTGRGTNSIRGKASPKLGNEGDPLPPKEQTDRIEDHANGDERTVTSLRSGRIKTLDDLLTETKVDRNDWKVERFTVNKWESSAFNRETDSVEVTELFQVKATLRPNHDARMLRELEDALIARIANHAPAYPLFPRVKQWSAEPHMLEVSPFDLHVGKLAWSDEVDGENYDSRIAGSVLMRAIEQLIAKSRGFAIERVLFPIGNDLLHTDTPEGTTTRGTRQDVDTRPLKMFVVAEQLMISAIDRLMELAPVDVIVIPGNHDRERSLMLGRVVKAHYRKCERVNVDAAPTLRKYVRYGVNLLGFTHGSEEKPDSLPLIMAAERPQDWAEALHREWHTGHMHKRKETKYIAGDTHGGVPVRILPSLSGTDYWHYSKGYVKGQRAAEAYLWARDSGYAGHFSSNVHVMPKAA